MQCGLDSPVDFSLSILDAMLFRLFKKKRVFARKSRAYRRCKKFRRGNMYSINGIKFPLLDKNYETSLFGDMFEDTFTSFLYFHDSYDEVTVNLCDFLLGEGLYGLQNDLVNVTVEPDDVVIDAGSWIGDFAAYASLRGGSLCL